MPAKPPNISALAELSSQLANAVETVAQSIVAIRARRRIPSSGILWRDDVVVSASHTVQRDADIPLILGSGETVTADVAGRDPATDVVVLRSSGARRGARSRVADAPVRVGSLALAVGRPGSSATASFGIVSAISEGWRNWHGARVDRALRLDLAIYDGFSGGAAADASGAIVGMTNSALARGTPMALTVATIDRIVTELLEHGHMRRPFIGVAVQPVVFPTAVVREHELPAERAVLVTAVAEKSPAERAGILVGDVLLRANGSTLARPTDLLDALADTQNGGAGISIDLLRGGTRRTVAVTPIQRGGRE